MEKTDNGINRKKEKAQGMVEFALTLPILLMLFFGIIEFGRLLFVYSAVTTSAREAARYGSAAGNDTSANPIVPYYMSCDQIRKAGLRIGGVAGVQYDDIIIYYDKGPDSSPLPVCSSSTTVELGYRIIVEVKSDFQPIVPLVNLDSFPITSKAKRTILTKVDLN